MRYRPPSLDPVATLEAMPQKRYLLTPGPTPVPPEVLAAMGEPVIHHRSPDFKAVFAETRARLRQVFRTENEVLALHGFRDRSVRVGRRQSPFAGREGARRLARELRHPLAEDGSGIRLRCRPADLRVGCGAQGRRRLARSRRERSDGRVARALRDVDRRRLGHPLPRRCLQRRRRDLGRRRHLEPRRGSARDRQPGGSTSS